MFKKTDPYTYTEFDKLTFQGALIGSVYSEFKVTAYDDVKLSGANSAVLQSNCKKYLVHAIQRINIFNGNGISMNPATNPSFYQHYPALLRVVLNMQGAQSGFDYKLLQYSPQTVNTKVQASGTTGGSTGQTSTSSMSSTVGSSTSETNSYGVSVNVGLDLSGGASANYEHSTTTTHDQSSTQGSEAGKSSSFESSASDSMSIKDWGAYSFVNPGDNSVAWTFGQEYPWDAISCRTQLGNLFPPSPAPSSVVQQVQLSIPDSMLSRLYDGTSLYPPSHLSMFGVNFVVKALWLVTIENGTSDEIAVTTTIDYSTASHILDTTNPPQGVAGVVEVYIDPQPTQLNSPDSPATLPCTASFNLGLTLMGLDPVGSLTKNAIVGFIPNKYIVQPSPGNSFRIPSISNDLIVMDVTKTPGSGSFTAGDTTLQASFTDNKNPLSIMAFFKVLDAVNDYTMYIKHWKLGTAASTSIMLTFTMNGDTKNQLVKYVDALESEGGENNVMKISLRNLDFATADYHDYIQMGLNSIQIDITPMSATVSSDCGYAIRAISIEKD